ncbi:hypothetical protein ABIA35_001602 [Catenulispora sp. MAP12-49]|uniref:hypothetical protein n=1 Tax=unclassified Catenulispora TaxID=414885 RepID=UPI0035167B7A
MKSMRIALVIAAVAGTAAVATGCAAGGGAETLQIQPNFAAGASGDLQALDMVVVVDPATGTAQVTGTVVNNGDQAAQLSGVTVNGKSVSVSGGNLDLAAHSALNLAAPNGPKMVLNNSGSVPGHNSPVALTFAGGAAISVTASTESNTGVYQQFQPSSAS